MQGGRKDGLGEAERKQVELVRGREARRKNWLNGSSSGRGEEWRLLVFVYIEEDERGKERHESC